jgi:hypothetical protein
MKQNKRKLALQICSLRIILKQLVIFFRVPNLTLMPLLPRPRKKGKERKVKNLPEETKNGNIKHYERSNVF